MKIIRNSLKGDLNLRTEKDFPTKGIEFIDINSLILQSNTLEEIIDIFVDYLKDTPVDYIVAPEARGFLFGSAVAYKLKCGCIPVRKKGKLPPSTVETSFEYEKEYGKDYLELPKLVKGSYKGKNYFIIDDIYATGNTNNGIKKAITDLGGNVLGSGAVINIAELNNDEVFSIIDVNEE